MLFAHCVPCLNLIWSSSVEGRGSNLTRTLEFLRRNIHQIHLLIFVESTYLKINTWGTGGQA